MVALGVDPDNSCGAYTIVNLDTDEVDTFEARTETKYDFLCTIRDLLVGNVPIDRLVAVASNIYDCCPEMVPNQMGYWLGIVFASRTKSEIASLRKQRTVKQYEVQSLYPKA